MRILVLFFQVVIFFCINTNVQAQLSEFNNWYTIGKKQQSQLNFPRANSNYLKALALCKPPIESKELKEGCLNCYFNLGVCNQKLEHYEDAKNYFSIVLEASPKDHEAYARRGDCYTQLLEKNKALEDLKLAYKYAAPHWNTLDPDTRYWYTHDLALAYRNVKKWEEAIQFINIAIMVKDELELRIEKARILQEMGRLNEVVRELKIIKRSLSTANYSFINQYVNEKRLSVAEANMLHSLVIADGGNWEEALRLADEAEATLKTDSFLQPSIHLHRANIHYRMGNFRDAIGEAEAVLQQKPTFALAMTIKGLSYLELGERKESHAAFASTSVSVSAEPLVKARKVWADYRLGDKDAAITDLYNILISNENEGEIHYYYAEMCYQTNRIDPRKCLNNLNQAIALHPHMEEPFALKARILQEFPKLGDAIAFLNRCQDLGVRHNYAALHLSKVYLHLQDESKALAMAELALRDEKDTDFQRNYGEILMAAKEWSTSIKHFSYCIETNHQDWKSLRNRAIAYTKTGHNKAAVADFTRAISIQPDDALLYSERARVRVLFGRYSEALADFNKGITLNPNLAEIHYQKARMYLDKREYGTALSLLHQALKVAEEDHTFINMGNLYNEKGLCLVELNKNTRALVAYSSGIQLQPNATLYENRANLLAEMNRHSEAIADYKQAANYNRSAENYFKMGTSQHEEALYREASQSFTIAIRIRLESGDKVPVEYYMKRGDSYFKMGAEYLALAEADFEKYKNAKPNNWQPLYYLGKCRYQKREYDDAVQFFKDAIEIDDQHEEVFISLGDALSILEKFSEAARSYGRAVQLNPEEICYLKKKGHAHLRDENWLGAVKNYQNAILKSHELNITIEVELYHGIGRAYAGKGYAEDNEIAYQLAIDNYKRALKIEGISAKEQYFIQLNMMTMYEKRGMTKKATKIKAQLLDSEPFRESDLLTCG